MFRHLCTLSTCLTLTAVLFAQTPSATDKKDTSGEAFAYERIANLVRFESDGTGIRDTTAVIRIQSQGGIQAFGQLIVGYSTATEKLEIDYARVRKPDGQLISTPLTEAQDFAPEILREAPMYSDYRQRHISVVGLQVGDELEYHTIVHIVAPLAPHEFWYEHVFPRNMAVGNERLEIDVPKARELKLKSPDQKYEVRENGDRRIYTWTRKNIAPNHDLSAEDEINEIPDEPDVQLSSFTDWQQIAHWYAKLQGERMAVDDSVRKKADELTRGATKPEEKARRLYDYVARNIRYVSLSFGVGRYQPHAASEVMTNGYGDCKDKHTLLATLLRAEGIPSYPVLIHSGRKLDPDVPSPAQFDHVITAVPLGSDLTWLDATAEVAPYGLIMYQLRNKQALLASEDAKAGLHRTPAEAPVKNSMTIKMDGSFNETGAFDSGIEMTAQGDSELSLRAAFRQVPQADWKRLLQIFSAAWGVAGEVSDIHLQTPEDTAKPFHLTFRIHKDNYFIVPTSGASFRVLPPLRLARLEKVNTKKASERLNVGPPVEEIYHAHIQFPANYSLRTPLAVRMARDYGEYSSSYTLAKNILDSERHLILKVNELPASRRSDYESFRNVTSSDEEQVLTASITPASGEAVASAGKASGTPTELRKSATAALQRKDFSTAAELLKRSLEQDANQKDAWDDLGRAYAALNNHDQAIRSFQKQLELDPFHGSANSDLAAELQQQGKLDDAVAAYRKQLEVTPVNRMAHKNLGLLLLQMSREHEAQPELEAAASLPPDDPEVKIALARIYANAGNKDKSQELMKSVLGVSAAATGPDLYASALRDDIDPNQTVRDARQTLDDIGEQFDSGEYDRLGPSAFSAMNLVALAWSRMGWAKFLQGENMEAMQFLNSAWMLSQSGTVGNRLARLLEKQGQRDRARHMYALAAVAGGAEAEQSRQAVQRLAANPAAADQELAQAAKDLTQARSVQLPANANGSAKFVLVFDSSSSPERVAFLEGDSGLSGAGKQLQQKEFSIKFPDVSSVKIIRRGTLSCQSSGCVMELLPAEGMALEPQSKAAK